MTPPSSAQSVSSNQITGPKGFNDTESGDTAVSINRGPAIRCSASVRVVFAKKSGNYRLNV